MAEEDYSIGKWWWLIFICGVIFTTVMLTGGIYLVVKGF